MRLLSAILSLSLIALPVAAADKLAKIGGDFSHPWGMDFIDDDTMLITERSGQMFRLDLASGNRDEIGNVPEVFHVGQGGLLDVKVSDTDPSVIYYCYGRPSDNGGSTAVDMARLDGNMLTERKTIFIGNNYSNGGRHFGCRLEISGDHLFATLGDRGERDNAQAPASHSGSVVRINLDGTIPEDNPNLEGWQPEVLSKGHRNAQGMALNLQTGEIWLHEHGPRGGDEINVVKPGANYGWPIVTFGEEYFGGDIGLGSSVPGFEDPAWVWVPSIAPSGMAFYQGDMFSEYNGHLLVGSLKFKSLYLVELNNNLPSSEQVILEDQIGRIRDVAVAADGAILLLTDESDGGLYRLSR